MQSHKVVMVIDPVNWLVLSLDAGGPLYLPYDNGTNKDKTIVLSDMTIDNS